MPQDIARRSTCPTEPIWLDADLTRLAQVVGNLLNNAAKYTPEGGRIALSLRREADAAVITVSDNGIGIPAEMQSEVFQLFAQVENHLDRARGGLGIGLALVKQLVVMHGGTVDGAKRRGRAKAASSRYGCPSRPLLPSRATRPNRRRRRPRRLAR